MRARQHFSHLSIDTACLQVAVSFPTPPSAPSKKRVSKKGTAATPSDSGRTSTRPDDESPSSPFTPDEKYDAMIRSRITSIGQSKPQLNIIKPLYNNNNNINDLSNIRHSARPRPNIPEAAPARSYSDGQFDNSHLLHATLTPFSATPLVNNNGETHCERSIDSKGTQSSADSGEFIEIVLSPVAQSWSERCSHYPRSASSSSDFSYCTSVTLSSGSDDATPTVSVGTPRSTTSSSAESCDIIASSSLDSIDSVDEMLTDMKKLRIRVECDHKVQQQQREKSECSYEIKKKAALDFELYSKTYSEFKEATLRP